MRDLKFNLTPEEAIAEMKVQLEKMQNETDRAQLKDLDSDTAYEMGYAVALFDYNHLTGPDPRVVELRIYPIPQVTNTVDNSEISE